MQDRFKFRVWDKKRNCYMKEPEPTPLLQADGLLAYFTNNPDAMNNYDIQFCTGLKDKNGKLIYEGDVVKGTSYFDNKSEMLFTIIWEENYCQFLAENNGVTLVDLMDANNIEVIGNVFEHKHLLEGD